MNRTKSILMSLGISVALIATGIWFLYNCHDSFGYGDDQWIMPHHMMMGGGGMGIIMILFWVAVIAAIALVVSGVATGLRSSSHRDKADISDALEILKQRFARGEIDKAQFESMRRDLR